MRHVKFSAYVFVVAIVSISLSFGDDKPTKSAAPLTADEIAVYKAVLAHYSSKEAGMLNVSIRTFPLNPESPRNGLSKGGCLQGMELENLTSASRTFHELTPEVLPGKNMKLVDAKKQAQVVRSNDPDKTMGEGKSVENAVASAFATGLFSMSEIAFDKERRHAVVSYSFWCGSLCGNGSTLVFEKIGQEWRRTDRNCGGWIS
jgi:hypothetical protein